MEAGFAETRKITAMQAEALRNTFIYLLGLPGTGKYTIAREISARADFRLVDNHLVNNPVFTVVRVDGKTPFPREVWKKVGAIGDIVLDAIETLSPPHFSFVFTNALMDDDPGDHDYFHRLAALAAKRNALFVPVRLGISVEENIRRIQSPDRDHRMKQTNIDAPEKYAARGVLQVAHPHLLNLDVTALSAAQAADAVLQHTAMLKNG